MAPALHARAPSRWPSDRHTWVRTPDGVDISVREWGNPEGWPILFVHGMPADYRAWGDFELPISARQRYISYSQRCFGSQPDTCKDPPASYQTYVDDLAVVGMRHLAFKRSDVAHGHIRSIDTSAAEGMDGVEAVFTGAQIAEFLAPMPIGTPFPSPDHRAVAVNTVRYPGEFGGLAPLVEIGRAHV